MALTITDLSKTYPNGVRALKNVSLTVGSGMFGLLGPNGAGKSSLMRTIATLQDPDSGAIHLDGIDVLEQTTSTYGGLTRTLGWQFLRGRESEAPPPQAIAATVVAIDGLRIRGSDMEALDGTPIIDVKPVLDAVTDR